jgi:hypothetical protein
MSETSPEVSPAPVVAAAIEVSEHQETRDTANAAAEEAQIAQASAEMAGNTASEAKENAEVAAEVAVESAAMGADATIEAAEAKQEAGEALSEIGQLRQDIFSRLDHIRDLVAPPAEEQEPDNGVSEVILDDGDIGESGIESQSRSSSPVRDSGAGNSDAGDSGTSTAPTRSARGFKRGRVRR